MPWGVKVVQFCFLVTGIFLLLEPLHRMGKLPRRLATWYEKKSFTSLPKSPKKLAFVGLLISAIPLAGLIYGASLITKEVPAFILFYIIIISGWTLQNLVVVLTLTVLAKPIERFRWLNWLKVMASLSPTFFSSILAR